MKTKIRYYGNLLIVGLVYIILDTYTDLNGTLLSNNNATSIYILQLLIAGFALFAMWSNFNLWKQKPFLSRMSLTTAALLVLVQYFLNFDTNLLWLLPMLAVVYIFRYDTLHILSTSFPPLTAAPHPTTAARLGLRPQEIFLRNP